ncbi:response regulator [Spirosoma knui]
MVDDDEDDFLLLATRIKECTQTVNLTHISDAEELFQQMQLGPSPDLIMIDARMPVVKGEELVKRIRDSAAWRHIPIIVWTGSISDDENIRLYEAGANSVVFKQDTLEQIRALCQYWFGLVRLPTVGQQA